MRGHRYAAARAVTVICLLLSAGRVMGEEPWAQTTAFTQIHELGTIVVPNAEGPATQAASFPPVPKSPTDVVVLRFKARKQTPKADGWNHYLELTLNGKQLAATTETGTLRLLNREAESEVFFNDKLSPKPYWGTTAGMGTSLLTFFGPDDATLDERIRADRDELYWYMLDISDLAHYRVLGQDDQVYSAEPNQLTVTNNLRRGLVEGEQFDLILDEVAIGTIPLATWQERVEAHLVPLPDLGETIRLRNRAAEVRIGAHGGMHLIRDGQTFGIDSHFSHPGDRVGWNALSWEPGEREHAAWHPDVQRDGRASARVIADCGSYRIERRVKLRGDVVEVSDTLTNTGREPIGVMVRHGVSTPDAFRDCLLAGVSEMRVDTVAENPTIFIAAEKASLGVVAEDNVLRRQFAASRQPNRASFRAERIGLDRGGSHTFEWTLRPMGKADDYWTFINRLRREWGANFTIRGPWDFFEVQRFARYVRDPDLLREYVAQRNLRLVALMPWLDYYNVDMSTKERITRARYKEMMQEAAAAFREVDPDIQVMACIESFAVPLSLERGEALFAELAGSASGKSNLAYPRAGRDLIEDLGLTSGMESSLIQDADGKHIIQVADMYGTRGLSLFAYPVVGNAHHERLMDLARFAIEEVGLDGIYVDCFSFSYGWPSMERTYDKWDGISAEVDLATGRIERTYLDTGLAGATSRAELIRYALAKGKVVVANSYAASRETQALPAFRLSEVEFSGFNPLAIGEGEKPPLLRVLTRGHLASPIGLGVREGYFRGRYADEEHVKRNYSKLIMKAAITYLRHGALYYHYSSDYHYVASAAGGVPHVADFGPINRMYPITPVELHEGWIIGRERIVTAVSGTFAWRHPTRPSVTVFNVEGKPEANTPAVSRTKGGWDVSLSIRDWENVAVIE